MFGKSKETKKKLEGAWLDRLVPMGSGANSPTSCLEKNVPDPLTLEPWGCGTVLKKFAGPDESDYNLHLSNSSYPKVSLRHDRSSLSATFSEQGPVR